MYASIRTNTATHVLNEVLVFFAFKLSLLVRKTERRSKLSHNMHRSGSHAHSNKQLLYSTVHKNTTDKGWCKVAKCPLCKDHIEVLRWFKEFMATQATTKHHLYIHVHVPYKMDSFKSSSSTIKLILGYLVAWQTICILHRHH